MIDSKRISWAVIATITSTGGALSLWICYLAVNIFLLGNHDPKFGTASQAFAMFLEIAVKWHLAVAVGFFIAMVTGLSSRVESRVGSLSVGLCGALMAPPTTIVALALAEGTVGQVVYLIEPWGPVATITWNLPFVLSGFAIGLIAALLGGRVKRSARSTPESRAT